MKLFVGNLPPTFEQKDLEDLFSEYTSVISTKLILDRETGRSKGFGFVEFSSKDEAQNAIDILNGKVVGTKPIVVNEARPQVRRESRPFNKRGGGNYR